MAFWLIEWGRFYLFSHATMGHYPAEKLAIRFELIGRNWRARYFSFRHIDMAHRTRQIALIKVMILCIKMVVFGVGNFPIENDLRRKSNLKVSHMTSKSK
jgi:hypothetical protein